MPTEADIGHGSDFQRGDGASPEVFATVGEVLSINGISITKDVVDATHMKSPDRYEEIITSIKRTGEISVSIQFKADSATTDAALADVDRKELGNYRIVFPDEAEWDFAAHCVGLSIDVELADKMIAQMTYKPSGKPSFMEAGS